MAEMWFKPLLAMMTLGALWSYFVRSDKGRAINVRRLWLLHGVAALGALACAVLIGGREAWLIWFPDTLAIFWVLTTVAIVCRLILTLPDNDSKRGA